jgi:hypothetical protein
MPKSQRLDPDGRWRLIRAARHPARRPTSCIAPMCHLGPVREYTPSPCVLPGKGRASPAASSTAWRARCERKLQCRRKSWRIQADPPVYAPLAPAV